MVIDVYATPEHSMVTLLHILPEITETAKDLIGRFGVPHMRVADQEDFFEWLKAQGRQLFEEAESRPVDPNMSDEWWLKHTAFAISLDVGRNA